MLFMFSLYARTLEMKELYKGKRFQEALGKLDEIADMCRRIPAMAGAENSKKLSGLRDTLRQYLSDSSETQPAISSNQD